tara:strand:+ start:1372 stop:1866 length:495 start_codon:yes stop_codon:yes gene_type:complete
MSKSKTMYGISRIDDEIYRTHAWRVSLRRQNSLIVKNFPDKSYGGKGKALIASKAYRDEMIDQYPPTTRQQFCSTPRRHNTSGIPGVYRYAKRYKLKDGCVKELWYWEAHWPDKKPGEFGKATFSIQRFGEQRAKQMAIAARETGVQQLEGVFWACERGGAKVA